MIHLQEQDADINFAFHHRFMQWGVVPRVPGIGVCPVGQQQGADVEVPEGAGIVKGDETAVISGMNVCTDRQKVLDCVSTSVAWKWRYWVGEVN